MVNGPSGFFIKKALPALAKAGLFNLLKDAFREARLM
jgi:hypothetical protein